MFFLFYQYGHLLQVKYIFVRSTTTDTTCVSIQESKNKKKKKKQEISNITKIVYTDFLDYKLDWLDNWKTRKVTYGLLAICCAGNSQNN